MTQKNCDSFFVASQEQLNQPLLGKSDDETSGNGKKIKAQVSKQIFADKLFEQNEKPANKIFWIETMFGSLVWGVSSFIYGLLDKQDFAVTCLSWTGFIFISLSYKIFEIYSTPKSSRQDIFESFIGQMRNKENRWHVAFRSINFFLMIWLVIQIGDYSQRANMNYGIILSLNCLSSVFLAIIAWIFFGERFGMITILGMLIVFSGTVLILVSRSDPKSEENQRVNIYSEEDRTYYRYLAIIMGVLYACIGTIRVIQAKFLNKKNGYSPIQFSIDAAFVCGMILFCISAYYFAVGHPTYTLYNFGVSFLASSLTQVWSTVLLRAIVKGVAAPTSAISNTNPIYTTILTAIFLGLTPNILQFAGMLLSTIGVVIMILLK
ncbi:UNKNOWN [Stylonychia lemnae]|uniref:EamA domain-containing protein n=1 Tax=Stylonychia lemnae TaxID=5949 RepID=A0A078AR84_STYLE|nr:UNKNOWN [Stylonychia lemnae]|eukprot:CDW84481.1 UNKNOWN [Stylonychia lemnae]